MFPELMALALAIEVFFGWPNWLYKIIRHPVVWIGNLISWLETGLNRQQYSHAVRYIWGAFTSLTVIGVATLIAYGVTRLLPENILGLFIEALIASSLLASRSLYQYVAAVALPLQQNNLPEAREAISHIIGRDPTQLDEAGIARASLETLAENASDGVIAPLFWGLLFGLPGLAAYKTINTLDSMIAYRNTHFLAFGGFAARVDDFANLIPARITGLLFSLASMKTCAFMTMLRDAHKHRSPNAGWPEAAMAGALGIRLSGPRTYGEQLSDEPWLNAEAPDPTPSDFQKGLQLYLRAMLLAALILGIWILFNPLR